MAFEDYMEEAQDKYEPVGRSRFAEKDAMLRIPEEEAPIRAVLRGQQTGRISTDPTLKDSRKRQEFGTGAVRDAEENKGRLDLMAPLPLMLYSLIMEMGAKKYAEHNWRTGMPIGRFIASGLRHLFKYMMGLQDEPHLSMAVWNFNNALHAAIQVDRGAYPSRFNDLFNDVNPGLVHPGLSEVEKEFARKYFGGDYYVTAYGQSTYGKELLKNDAVDFHPGATNRVASLGNLKKRC